MQAVEIKLPVRLLLRVGEMTALRSIDAMPLHHFSRTDDGRGIDGIYMIDRQNEHLRRVATKTIRSGVISDTRFAVGRTMPNVRIAFVHMVYVLDRIRTDNVQGQDDRGVTTCVMESIGVDTGLVVCLVAERITLPAADGLGDMRLGDIVDRQT